MTSTCYKAYFQQNMNCNPLIFMGMRLPWKSHYVSPVLNKDTARRLPAGA
jgi:hypothetical protein